MREALAVEAAGWIDQPPVRYEQRIQVQTAAIVVNEPEKARLTRGPGPL